MERGWSGFMKRFFMKNQSKISKKIIPIIAISVFGCLLAYWTVKGNYFLILITFLPLFIFLALGLVLKGTHSMGDLKEIDKPHFPVRSQHPHLLALILVLVIIGLNVFAPGEPTIFQRLLASLILVLGFVPAFTYIKRNESGIPFLPLLGVIYSIYYALPIFTLEEYAIKFTALPQASLEKALLLATLGFLMLLLSYYKLPGKSIGRHLPRISIYWNPQKAKFWAIILCFFGLLINYLSLIVQVPTQFTAVILFLSQLSIVGMGVLFILQLHGNLNWAGKLLLWAVFLPIIILFKLGTGSIAQILFIIIFLSLTYWHFRRKIPWKTAVGGALLFIALLSVRGEFRELTWGGVYAEISPIEKGMLFSELVFTERELYTIGFELALTRIAHNILTFGHVVDLTPETVPYWMGKTYLTLLWTPIPRVIFPWKPEKTLGQEFGHRYGFLNPFDLTTSYNLPQLVEMYANFGVIGVIIGMFLVGIIYRALYEMLCHPKAGEGGLLIGLFIFMGLTNIESDLPVVFGSLFYNIILLVIINRLMKRKSQEQ
ncbi:MAG: hypothetical protein DDT22_00808 [candidate division WS2 bacterium]|nr:hypothetical protein [Candidatus Lithacetigena glycinireducens]